MVRHLFVAVHSGVRKGWDTNGDIVGAGGLGRGVADPFAGFDVETLAGLDVEFPVWAVDMAPRNPGKATANKMLRSSRAAPGRSRAVAAPERAHGGRDSSAVSGAGRLRRRVIPVSVAFSPRLSCNCSRKRDEMRKRRRAGFGGFR